MAFFGPSYFSLFLWKKYDVAHSGPLSPSLSSSSSLSSFAIYPKGNDDDDDDDDAQKVFERETERRKDNTRTKCNGEMMLSMFFSFEKRALFFLVVVQ